MRYPGIVTTLSASLALTLVAGDALAQARRPTPAAKPAAAKTSDEDVIRAQAAEFAALFAKGDAKGIAATWTEQAEYADDANVILRGRTALEAAFSKFFSEHPGAKIEFRIDSIRFPSRDLAIEQGLSVTTTDAAELPSSTRYLVVHVREDGQWLTAIGKEWGADEDKLEDLAWIIGDWSAAGPHGEARFAYKWTPNKSAIEGTFEIVKDGKPLTSGRQHIIRDPQTGVLRSWTFDDAGGHGETSWTRDGDRWVLEASGVAADGASTSAVNVLTRLADNEYLWRFESRTHGGVELPHPEPIKLTRATAAK